MSKTELPPLVQSLLNPAFYPHKCTGVSLLQTQMSFIFLTGEYAYKIKMPVNLGYLDYTTLENRKYFCDKELLLNKRLAPDVYLEVIPIVKHGEKYTLGGTGQIVEYTLKMRQLPQDRMMDVLLAANKVSDEMVAAVACKLAEFHSRAETNLEISQYGSITSIHVNTEENFNQTRKYIGTSISLEQFQAIENYTNDFMKKNTALLERRVNNGRIRDCHGDVHSAHVCFTDSIAIFDCIEFNDRFRYCDVASEIAFLAMDLEYSGHYHLAAILISSYINASLDQEIYELLNFYKCYRAYVRGKVWSFKIDLIHLSQVEKDEACRTANKYFALACSYTRVRPLLIMAAGLMGTGKSTLMNAAAAHLRIRVISSDVTRKQLVGIPLTRQKFEDFDKGIYTSEFTRRTYQQMFDWARESLRQRQSVILDASFKARKDRKEAMDMARETGAQLLVIECVLDEELVKKRLEQRIREGSVSDGRWELLGEQKKSFEEITEIPPENHLVIDTAKPVTEIVKDVLTYIENMSSSCN